MNIDTCIWYINIYQQYLVIYMSPKKFVLFSEYTYNKPLSAILEQTKK